MNTAIGLQIINEGSKNLRQSSIASKVRGDELYALAKQSDVTVIAIFLLFSIINHVRVGIYVYLDIPF